VETNQNGTCGSLKAGGKTMAISETITSVRYVTDSNGEKTDVLIPLSAWKTLLATWKKTIELLEDQEDKAILQEWVDNKHPLENRAAGKVEMISLDALEQELVADGLLPG
jgi:hypothetical protein